MDFLNFEVEADSGDDDDDDEQDFDLSDDDDDFIDNSSDISESVCNHDAFENAQRDVDEVLKELFEKGVSDLDIASK